MRPVFFAQKGRGAGYIIFIVYSSYLVDCGVSSTSPYIPLPKRELDFRLAVLVICWHPIRLLLPAMIP